jgi:hypothetical protein
MAPGQGHYLVVLRALAQGVTQIRVPFAEGNEGVELADFFEKPLQIGIGHGN